jgi:hypothetical protein
MSKVSDEQLYEIVRRCQYETEVLPTFMDRIDVIEACHELIGARKRLADAEAEIRLLWAALTDAVGIERVNALSSAVLAGRKNAPAPALDKDADDDPS